MLPVSDSFEESSGMDCSEGTCDGGRVDSTRPTGLADSGPTFSGLSVAEEQAPVNVRARRTANKRRASRPLILMSTKLIV